MLPRGCASHERKWIDKGTNGLIHLTTTATPDRFAERILLQRVQKGRDVLNREVWKKRFKAILSLDNHPGHIAAGFAVGVFISFTPFFTFHTIIAISAAFILRLNKLTCVTGSWVNTPITVLPVLGVSYKLGRFLLGLPPGELHVRGLEWGLLKSEAASLLLGSSILGFVAAVASYFICYYLVVRFRRKDATLDVLTREMETTGEELE